MTEPQSDERTTGGLAGKVTGKAKELAGELTNNDDLAREGRLQQAQGEAGREAAEARNEARQADAEAQLEEDKVETAEERQRLEAELAQRQTERAAQRDREQTEINAVKETAGEVEQAEATREREHAEADRRNEAADAQERDLNQEALALKRKAREAESKADALDPKETR